MSVYKHIMECYLALKMEILTHVTTQMDIQDITLRQSQARCSGMTPSEGDP